LAISPTVKQDPRIPNEDSVDFEFDEIAATRTAGTEDDCGG